MTSGTSFADPTPAVPETISGSTYGIGYTLTRTDADTLTTTLTGGTFRRAEDGIDVLAPAGEVVAHLPLKVALDERHDAELAPKIEDNKLIADVSAKEIGTWRKTSPWERSIGAGVGIGAVGGALVGGFLGLILGIATGGLLLPITLPVGLIVGLLGGMAAGGAAGAAVPNSQTPDQWQYEKECEYYGDYRVCW
ncbi:hypothetical protein [Micromonospora sp. NPDC048169]|uniref:hypothetical protein n=1 Tax=Micromonospora sp. NPDC048169 TaxID=3154711 RepID=UPI0033E3C559